MSLPDPDIGVGSGVGSTNWANCGWFDWLWSDKLPKPVYLPLSSNALILQLDTHKYRYKIIKNKQCIIIQAAQLCGRSGRSGSLYLCSCIMLTAATCWALTDRDWQLKDSWQRCTHKPVAVTQFNKFTVCPCKNVHACFVADININIILL